jgi:hypothetical protein
MESKKSLGQFYTTNCEYILENMKLPENIQVIEPFVGQGDLVNWINKNIKYTSIETYDLDPKIKCDKILDTIKYPPIYENKFVITNPPFLARNKTKNKELYDKYNVDDIYKAFIITLIEGNCEGGIIIIPLNFFSSENSEIRVKFLSKYFIESVNVFEEKVFNDTSYTVCSFNFFKKENIEEQNVNFIIYPSKKQMRFKLSIKNGYKIGGNILKCKNKYKLGRLLIGQKPSTQMTLYSVDSGTQEGRIRLMIDKTPYFGKQTDRVFCTITCPYILKNQKELCEKFNSKLEELRVDYNSLFLTNFRESTKHYSRKRISFKQGFSLLSEIISENENYFISK